MSQSSDQLDAVALGTYLTELRGDLTQNRASKLVGTHPSNLKNWEQGRVIPSVPSLYGIARGYGIPLERLIARLVPDYRRSSDARVDEVVQHLLETTPPDGLTEAQVHTSLDLPTPPPLPATALETLVVAIVAAPMSGFVADLTRASSLDTGAVEAIADALGDLASRLPATVFTHRAAYPDAARALLDRYDVAITEAAHALSGDDPTRLVALRVRFSGWLESARVVAELGGSPIQRTEAVILAVGAAR